MSLHTNYIPSSAQPNTYHTAALLAVLCCAIATAKVQAQYCPKNCLGPKVSLDLLGPKSLVLVAIPAYRKRLG